MTMKMICKAHKQKLIKAMRLRMKYKNFMRKDWVDNSHYKSKNRSKRYSTETSK